MKKHAVLSLSGGLDSASLLADLLNSNQYDTIHAFAFNYGQRHKNELICANTIAEFWKARGKRVEFQIIDVRDVFNSSQSALNGDNNQGVEVPKEDYRLEVSKTTVVENRNIIFSAIIYGKALAISKKYNVSVDITMGVHAGDHAVYPDCTPESVEAAQHLYKISNWGSERINYVAPFVNKSKGELLQSAISALEALDVADHEIDFYFANTNTCYDPIEIDGVFYACGKCSSCRERLRAFEFVGRKDPAKYISDLENYVELADLADLAEVE